MCQIVVTEDVFLGTGTADALDHRGMVVGVGEDDAVRQIATEGRQGCLVGNIAGGKDQGIFLAMEVGKLAFQHVVIAGGAADVAGTTGTGASLINGLFHGVQDGRVLAHTEIVIRAPDRDFALGTCFITVCRFREMPGVTAQIGEYAISAFVFKRADVVAEKLLVIHNRIDPKNCHRGEGHPRWMTITSTSNLN